MRIPTRLIGGTLTIGSLLANAALAASPSTLPAFPGAEGFGAGASGGRGGEVYAVTNLNDDGPGSLRDAISQPNRTVVFRVSGTIELKSRLSLRQNNITIAGQTAPGDGICLKGHELFITTTDNVIVRFLRLRPGDIAGKEHDALTIWAAKNVIIDHCSLSWSTDSLNDVVRESGNVTVQWCLLSEPLVKSVHGKGDHGYATGWDGRTHGGMSAHNNLIAHAASRAPRIGYYRTGRGLIDVRNNVIYNSGPSYGGETDDFNYVGNYYRTGPDSKRLRPVGELFAIWADDTRMYQSGNVVEGGDRPEGFISFRGGVHGTATRPTAERSLVPTPFDVPAVQTRPAMEAYEVIVERVGARLPTRDSVDTRVLNDVRNRTGRLIDSQNDVGGWPELKSTEPPLDTDGDGMPDAWETANGLDPHDPADGPRAQEPGGYTHLERYLNSLVE